MDGGMARVLKRKRINTTSSIRQKRVRFRLYLGSALFLSGLIIVLIGIFTGNI